MPNNKGLVKKIQVPSLIYFGAAKTIFTKFLVMWRKKIKHQVKNYIQSVI